MTTTLTKKSNGTSKMNYFTTIESVNIKLIGILFILFLNISHLSAQDNSIALKTKAIIYPTSTYYKQKAKSAKTAEAKRIYTFYLAKTFPVLEGPAKQLLAEKDDSDTFDYNAMFCGNSTAKVSKEQENNMALAIQ